METTQSRQTQWLASLSKGHDTLCVVPTGQAWFDAVPWDTLIDPQALTLAVYPNYTLLKNHLFRLSLQGIPSHQYVALTGDLPPHAQRIIWQQVAQAQIPLLMLTARKLQSINTLSQLIRHPRLGPIILEQGHLVLPHLWGPIIRNPYEKLVQLFMEQWPTHPPLAVFAPPLPLREQQLLTSSLNLRHPTAETASLPLDRLQIQVRLCFIPWQKQNALFDFVNTENPKTPSISIIICNSAKQVLQLESRLKNASPFCFHRYLDETEREMQLMQILHRDETVVVIENSMIAELPLYQIPFAQIRLMMWQLPWSCEALVQQILPAIHPDTQRIEALLLYSRDDLSRQKYWLDQQTPTSGAKSICFDHLNRVRHFYLRSVDCRQRQLKTWLNQPDSTDAKCGVCDACQNQQHSSLWRNLLKQVLY